MTEEKQYVAYVLRPFSLELARGSYAAVYQKIEQYLNHYYPKQWEEWNDGHLFGLKNQPGTPLGHVCIEEVHMVDEALQEALKTAPLPSKVLSADPLNERFEYLENKVEALQGAILNLQKAIRTALGAPCEKV